MEEQKFTVANAAIKNGVIVGLISIVLTTVNYMFALYESTPITWAISIVSILISVYFIYASHSLFKENNNGFMTYGQGLGIGVLLSLVSSVISAVFNWVYISFVDDSIIGYQQEQSMQQMIDRGMSQEQIDQAMEISASFTGPTAMFIIGILAGVFFGFIISLIVSAITKKNDPSLEM